MALFDNREQAFETKFKIEEENRFKRDVRAVRLLAMWAIGKAGIYGPAAMAYATETVAADMERPGIEDVLSKIQSDLSARGVGITPQQIKQQFSIFRAEMETSCT